MAFPIRWRYARAMLDMLTDALDGATGWFFAMILQPGLYAAGLMGWEEEAYRWAGFLLLGLLQVAVVYLVCRPLEAWQPVEPRHDRRAIRTDVVYTLLARLGILPLIAFALFTGVESRISG